VPATPASTRLQRSARVELMVGLLVIVVTAVLVAMPTPLR
jgi:putative copper export protein